MVHDCARERQVWEVWSGLDLGMGPRFLVHRDCSIVVFLSATWSTLRALRECREVCRAVAKEQRLKDKESKSVEEEQTLEMAVSARGAPLT